MRTERNSDQGGLQTHNLWILLTVAQPTQLQGQNRSRLLVLDILFHSRETSNQGLGINIGHVALTLE